MSKVVAGPRFKVAPTPSVPLSYTAPTNGSIVPARTAGLIANPCATEST